MALGSGSVSKKFDSSKRGKIPNKGRSRSQASHFRDESPETVLARNKKRQKRRKV